MEEREPARVGWLRRSGSARDGPTWRRKRAGGRLGARDQAGSAQQADVGKNRVAHAEEKKRGGGGMGWAGKEESAQNSFPI